MYHFILGWFTDFFALISKYLGRWYASLWSLWIPLVSVVCTDILIRRGMHFYHLIYHFAEIIIQFPPFEVSIEQTHPMGGRCLKSIHAENIRTRFEGVGIPWNLFELWKGIQWKGMKQDCSKTAATWIQCAHFASGASILHRKLSRLSFS